MSNLLCPLAGASTFFNLLINSTSALSLFAGKRNSQRIKPLTSSIFSNENDHFFLLNKPQILYKSKTCGISSIADWDMCSGRNIRLRTRSFCASIADWDMCSGRNVNWRRVASQRSIADWDMCSGRNLATYHGIKGDSIADWDMCSGRNLLVWL